MNTPNNIELRDWFAGLAMQSLIAARETDSAKWPLDENYDDMVVEEFQVEAREVNNARRLVTAAYCIADYMMYRRSVRV